MAITFNGNPTPQLDLPNNVLVNLNCTTVGLNYVWTLLDRPNPSVAAALSNPLIQAPTLTPDCSGSYFFRCEVDGVAEYGLFGVLTQRTNQRIPAAGEGDISLGGPVAGAESWAESVEALLRDANKNAHKGSIEIAQNVSGGVLAKGDVVFVNGRVVLDAALPEEEVIATVTKAQATSSATLGAVGIVLGGRDLTTPIANLELVLVALMGIVDGFNTIGTVVNDPVYVSDVAGAISFVPGTVAHLLGRVAYVHAVDGAIEVIHSAESGVLYTWDGTGTIPGPGTDTFTTIAPVPKYVQGSVMVFRNHMKLRAIQVAEQADQRTVILTTPGGAPLIIALGEELELVFKPE